MKIGDSNGERHEMLMLWSESKLVLKMRFQKEMDRKLNNISDYRRKIPRKFKNEFVT